MRHQTRAAARARAAIALVALLLAGLVSAAPATANASPGAAAPLGLHSVAAEDTASAQHQQRSRQQTRHRAPRWEKQVTLRRRDWGMPMADPVPWDASPQSVDRLVHLAGLVMGSALVLGGFRRGRHG